MTVLGEFNKGKTFALNHMTGSTLPAGRNVETQGLSFKRLVMHKRSLLLLDTQGSNSPLAKLAAAGEVEKKVEEQFLRDLCFEMADLFLVVVNYMSRREQAQLRDLCRDLYHSRKAFKKVLVLHNLKEDRTAADMHASVNALKRAYQPYTTEEQQEIEVRGEKRTVVYLEGRLHDDDDPYAHCQTHFFIGKEGTEAGENNPWVFAKIQQILLAVESRGEWNMMDRLRRSLERVLQNYVTPTPTIEISAPHAPKRGLTSHASQHNQTQQLQQQRRDWCDRSLTGESWVCDDSEFEALEDETVVVSPQLEQDQSQSLTTPTNESSAPPVSEANEVTATTAPSLSVTVAVSTQEDAGKVARIRYAGPGKDNYRLKSNPTAAVRLWATPGAPHQLGVPMDIYETVDDLYVVHVELAGLSCDDVRVVRTRSTEGFQYIVRVEPQPAAPTLPAEKIKKTHSQTRVLQRTSIDFPLPAMYDGERISVAMANGLLIIQAPRITDLERQLSVQN
eukprot:TRINITY_DN13457_c0_g1_i2.p1 TRINITY_DN13457_c0_g1~~TRINITY_DN13457_c0_g1_i2.p1  ORF type:complete len:505 (+),score=105.91 TRINITY_DN13457_c0_g1_i2:1538-3052(+)